MALKQFTILNSNENQNSIDKVRMLINIDQIVSVKTINITDSDQRVIEGYWVRLTNGKKYKAISVPQMITELFDESLAAPKYLNDSSVEMQVH